MRVIVLGGTRFIGRAIVHNLAEHGHQVMVVHRGEVEPENFPDVQHVHAQRKDYGERKDDLAAFGADAVVDTIAGTRASALLGIEAIDGDLRRVVLSSVDVYRAYGALQNDQVTDAVPFNEDDPVRTERFPYRGKMPGADDYEKLDVEEEYRARGGIVCRLPMVYGEHDYQRREEFILRRVRAGRERIPIGAGTWLTSRGYVGDIADGVRRVVEATGMEGEIFNLCERRSASAGMWAQMILDAAGSTAELVRVPDDVLPADMELTGSIKQHLLADASKARRLLGWTDTDAAQNLRRTVAWHLANPPQPDGEQTFADDDKALEAI